MEYDEETLTGWALWNVTDGVFADPAVYPTKEAAADAAARFPERYRAQGYYKTADGLRIDPREVEIEVVPVGN